MAIDSTWPAFGKPTSTVAPARYDEQVVRTELVSWFSGLSDAVVLVTAPAGYGKTTLLQQWTDSQPRPVAWLTLDASDGDPVVLLGYVSAALEAFEPLASHVFSGPLSDPLFFEQVVLPRFGQALRRQKQPFLFVVDDVHTLSARQSWLVLSTLIGCLPEGSLLVLSGRAGPPPFVTDAVGGKRLKRVGQADLAFAPADGAELLRSMGLRLSEEEESALVARTEGWPAALYLAALSLRSHPDPAAAVASFSGTSAVVSDYLRDEFLSRTSPEIATFLTRTAILGDVSGPLCDDVLGGTGSADMLVAISRNNLLLRATDAEQGWYRYHHLFADMLRAELHRLEPEREAELHRRASTWFEQNGHPARAVAHALRAGDAARAAELVWAATPALITGGRRLTVERWLDDFSPHLLVADPLLALASAWCALSRGAPVESWLLTAELALQNGERLTTSGISARGAVALLRAILAARGARAMVSDAELAHELDPPGSPGGAVASYLAGAGHHLLGNAETGAAWLEAGRRDSRALPIPTVWALSAAQLGLNSALEGSWTRGTSLIEEAMEVVETFSLQQYATMAPVFAAFALAQAHARRHAGARIAASHARGLLTRISGVAPWLAVEVRTVLARTHLLLDEPSAATSLLAEAGDWLPRAPEAPVLVRELEEVRALARGPARDGPRRIPTLTDAEWRVMTLLPTHLSFEEIAAQLLISKNTVKTQAISAYRKLDVQSRSSAVQRMRDLGLIDP